jgi:penicillin-binding protein 1C
MWDVSGLTGAAPVWLEIMNRLHRQDAGSPPDPPVTLARCSIRSGSEPRKEWFIHGTEPDSPDLEAPTALPRIVYPLPGAVFAIDPDIPPKQQRIVFAAHGRCTGLHWNLDGLPLGSADARAVWFPTPGRHFLSLNDAYGVSVDALWFRVRGDTDPSD